MGRHAVATAAQKNYYRPVVKMRFIALLAFLVAAITEVSAAQQTIAFWQDGHNSALKDEELLRYAVASPPVPFPEEAQKSHLTGSGVYDLQLNKNGAPTQVVVVKSSGHGVLDRTAIATFRKWRFKPGVFARVRVPVSWSVNRVR